METQPLKDGFPVALREESVDRNEAQATPANKQEVVALREESVDRNMLQMSVLPVMSGRSPRGERG